MARRISITEQASVKKTINPYSQPCFTAYALNHSHGGGFWMYDHNLNLITGDHGDGSYSYGSFRTHSTSASQFFESSNNYPDTQSDWTPSSSSDRLGGTNSTGYLGHQSLMRGCTYGNFGGWAGSGSNNGRNPRSHAFRECAPLVNETHQDYAMFTQHNGSSGTWLYLGPRSCLQYYDRIHHGTWGHRVNIPAQSSGGQGMYASACYNAKTRKLLIMESDGSFNMRPVVWNNVPDLRYIAHHGSTHTYGESSSYGEQFPAHNNYEGSLHQYFQDSSNCTVYTSNNFNTNSYSGEGEANWRCMPILNDDDSITVFHMMPSWGALVYRWNSSGTPTGTAMADSWTTSYGYEQGVEFGYRWQVSSDGKYIWGYCPSYYYPSGIYIAMIRVSDGKFLKWQNNDSTYGFQSAPLGKSDMIFFGCYNTDSGNGAHFRTVNLPLEFAVRDDATTLNLGSHWMNYTLECGHYSTSYPAFIPSLYDTSLFSESHLVPDLQ